MAFLLLGFFVLAHARVSRLSWLSDHTGHDNIFSVSDFGAIGDGKSKDTLAIRKAVEAVEEAGSGTIFFPGGGRYLTGPFNLTSHCTVFIDTNATLLASTDVEDWPELPAMPSYGAAKKGGYVRRTSLVHGQNLTDVVVTGANGTIDGQGPAWWSDNGVVGGSTPPHLIEFMWSAGVEISNLTLINSAFWTVHPVYTNGFVAKHLTILNNDGSDPNVPRAHNSDGIDPDSCSDVLIANCYIRTGDDGIAVKSGWDEYGYGFGMPSKNITIRDNTISTPCAAIAIGSEMSGGVSDIRVTNCHLWDSTAGVHIKSGPGRGGYVHNVSFEDIIMDSVATGIMFDTDSGGHPPDDATHHLNMNALPDIRHISVQRVVGKNSTFVAKLQGLAQSPLADISFASVHFDGGAYLCSNVSGTYNDMEPRPCDAIAPQTKFLHG